MIKSKVFVGYKTDDENVNITKIIYNIKIYISTLKIIIFHYYFYK